MLDDLAVRTNVSGDAIELVRHMLKIDPRDRISAREARQAKCFQRIWDLIVPIPDGDRESFRCE
jgi:serine/threonine protein kinase